MIMIWKEFFIPDIKKIILTIVLLGFSYFLFISIFTERFIGMCIVCIQCPCYPDQVLFDYEYAIAPIFYYLVSCLLVWIGPYKEKEKKSFKTFVEEIRKKK